MQCPQGAGVVGTGAASVGVGLKVDDGAVAASGAVVVEVLVATEAEGDHVGSVGRYA